MSEGVVGVWLLRAFHLENVATGERSEPFGPRPRGTLILHPGGRMAALLTPGEGAAPVGEAGQGPAARPLVAYSGRYRLEPPDRFVTTVDVASFESWVGTDQTRTYRLDGDRLEILIPPSPMPRADGSSDIVSGLQSWERDTATDEQDRATG